MTDEIQSFAKAWDSAFNGGEMSKLAGFYVDAARVIPAGGEPVDGNDAIGTFFADVRAKGLTTHRIDVHAVVDRGDTAIASGTWRLTGSAEGGEAVKFGGNWVNVLAREGDGWRILLHTWN